MGIPLYTQEIILKFIRGLHNYLRHTILMLNPTNPNEVCVQATNIEYKGNTTYDNVSLAESIHLKEGTLQQNPLISVSLSFLFSVHHHF